MSPNKNHQNTTVAYPPNHQNPHTTTNEDNESFLLAMQIVNTLTFPMVMQAIIELDVLEIIAREGQGAQLSPSQIASHLPTKNPEAPMMLDRMMRLLACHNMLTCSVITLESGKAERMYGLAPVCKFFVKDGNGISLAPFIKWMHHKDLMQSCLSQFQSAVINYHFESTAIIELNVLDIIAREGQGAQLTPSQIASHLPTKNPEAPMMLDRMMRLLACHNMLTCSVVTLESGKAERMYGLAPLCKFFVKDGNGISLAPFIKWMHHKDLMQSWYHLKDAVLEGGVPFDMAYGMDVFQYFGEKAELHELFNRMQFIHTTTVTNKILETYKGFHGLKKVVDVGGGLGVMIDSITTKYPTIQGINFDLPQVIEHAPRYQGVEHIGGDMFISIPKGETIFMKFVLHDWNDEQCLILLKNCYKALPNHGKVIVVEIIAPVIPRDNASSRVSCQEDIIMMAQAPGGKERTEKEFEALALGAGFVGVKLVCSACYYWVMEFHK